MDIKTTQTLLWRLGYDPQGVDGVDGKNTKAAKAAFCSAMGIETDAFETTLVEQGSHLRPFIQAKNYTPSTRPNAPHAIDHIVIHTMEAQEKPKTARNVATWFGGPNAPQASAHFCVDDIEVIQSVLECDVAWHAPGANNDGIGIEHAGFASQTLEQWDDEYSNAVLKNSAVLAAELAKRFDIPVVWLSVEELKAGKRGFCGHIDCTNAFSNGHGHTDPGPNFPKEKYLDLVRQAMG